jgi:ribose/xylose/arabinose/galactoside ABC-type transport system permease subunit
VAIGEVIVIISADFDLSIGSVSAFIAVVFVLLLHTSLGPVPAFLIAMLASLGIGFLNGWFSWTLGLPSLLVTLGFLFVYRGFVFFLSNGFAVSIPNELRDDPLISFLGGQFYGVANAVLFCVVILAVVTFVLTRMRLGNHLMAVGGDLGAATACGVPVSEIKILAFTVCAALAGFTGIVIACSLSSVSPTTSEGLEFEAIAAVVIGGCSLRGGVGSAWGTVLGVATLMALKAGLILMGTNIFTYEILLGVVLVSLISVKGLFPRMFAVRA